MEPKWLPKMLRKSSSGAGGLRESLRERLGKVLAPNDPQDLKKPGFRMEGVAFSQKSRGSRKTPKKRNLAIEEREAREKREPQASQATEKTRRRAQKTARRTKAKHHEAQP